MLSGATMSIDDIKQSPVKAAKVKEGEAYVNELRKMADAGLLTDDERYQLAIKK